MDKMNWLSGILTVGSMVMAGVAIHKAKQHQSCEDYAWKCHNEVMYDLDIARKDLQKTKEELEETTDLLERSVKTTENMFELHEKQKQIINDLREKLMK